MPSMPRISPAIWKPVTWSRPSSVSTSVLKKPARTAKIDSNRSPARYRCWPRLSLRPPPIRWSSRDMSLSDRPKGRQSSRKLHCEHATLRPGVMSGTTFCLTFAYARCLIPRSTYPFDICQCDQFATAASYDAVNFCRIQLFSPWIIRNSSSIPELIRRFDVNGPRYTSYPTADRFVEAFDANAHALAREEDGGRHSRPLVIIRAHPVLQHHLLLLRLQQDHHQGSRPFRQVHQVFGQGNRDAGAAGWQPRRGPVALRRRHADLPQRRRNAPADGHHPQAFPHAADNGEYSIEVDPRKVDRDTVAHCFANSVSTA
jgi:hypothetical protein